MKSYYYDEVIRPINSCEYVVGEPDIGLEVIQIDEKLIQATVEGKLHFVDGSSLVFNEKVEITQDEVDKPNFRYNYMNSKNKLLIGWHSRAEKKYKRLKSYPRHKHIGSDVKECFVPTMKNILIEIEPYIIKPDIFIE